MFEALIRRTGGRRIPGELALETTTFSLTTQVPRPAERRLDERVLLMLPLATLVSEDRKDFCRIRNISAGGLLAEVTSPQTVGTRIHVELHSGHRVAGEIAWVRGTSVGIRFDQNVDLRELLAEHRPVGGHPARPPRLEITCGAVVHIGKYYHQAEVHDISLGGMKIDLNDWECVGKSVEVTIDSFRMVKGKVRWHRAGKAGIVFDRPLTFEELALWMSKRVEIASLKAGAWEKTRH